MVSPVYELIKIIASVYQTGGDYFLCDLLPSVYPSSKQVKPKPNTAMRPSNEMCLSQRLLKQLERIHNI